MKLSRLAPVLALLAATASAQVTAPYSEDFSAALGAEWTLTSSAADGRIILGQNGSVSPASGGNSLVMDSSTSGGSDVINEARLSVDIAATSGAFLSYYFKHTSDEDDAPDGVFLNDGVNTVQLTDHRPLATDTWTQFTVDLGVAAGANGLNPSSLEIIFSQSDNFPVPTDGGFYDDVEVMLPPTPDLGQANSGVALLDVNSGTNIHGQPAVLGINGPFASSGSTLQLTFAGEANQRFLLLLGDLQVNALVLPPLGSLDLDVNTIVVALDGNSPGFLNSLAQLDGSGNASLTFGTGSLPPGLFATLQAAIFNTGASVVEFTAATEFTVL